MASPHCPKLSVAVVGQLGKTGRTLRTEDFKDGLNGVAVVFAVSWLSWATLEVKDLFEAFPLPDIFVAYLDPYHDDEEETFAQIGFALGKAKVKLVLVVIPESYELPPFVKKMKSLYVVERELSLDRKGNVEKVLNCISKNYE